MEEHKTMSTLEIAYDPHLPPLTDATPLTALPTAFKAVVLEEMVTGDAELAVVRSNLNKWAQSLPYHPHQDLGDRVKLLHVQKCHSYRVSLTTHIEERRLKTIQRACPDPAKRQAKNPILSLDVWRFTLPPVNPFAAVNFPDRILADNRVVLPCVGCNGTGRITCKRCRQDYNQNTCDNCGGKREISCDRCQGNGSFEEFVCLQRNLCCKEHVTVVAHPRAMSVPAPAHPSNTPPLLESKRGPSTWPENTAGVLIATVAGGQIPRDVGTMISISAVGQAVRQLVDQYSRDKNSRFQRVLQQRLEVHRLTGTEVCYEFNGRPYVCWLRDQEAPPAAERLPAALTLGQSVLKRAHRIQSDRMHVAPDIPKAKLRAARTAYAPTLDTQEERVLCLLDDSLFRAGTKGAVLTDHYFYFHDRLADQPYCIALNDLRSVIPRFNDPAQTTVTVNGSIEVRMKHLTPDQRGNFIALLTEIATGIHEDNYEPPSAADNGYSFSLEQRLEAVILVLVQTALWDSADISKEERTLLLEKTRQWAGVLSLYLTELEAEEKLRKAKRQSASDADQEATHHLDRAIAILANTLKSESHARLFADVNAINTLHGRAADGQMDFVAMLAKELPAPTSDKPHGKQRQLEAVAYLLHQAALWDLNGVSQQELAQLKKSLLDWSVVLGSPLQHNETEGLLERADLCAQEDFEQTGTRWLDQSFTVLRSTLNPETHKRLLEDLNAIIIQHGESTEGQESFLARVAIELSAYTE